MGCAALAAAGKAPGDGSVELGLVFLERQREVGTALEHSRREGAIAMQRIGGDDAAFEREHPQHVERAFGLVAARRLARRQREAGFCRKDIDHLQRRAALAALVGATQRLAVDRHDPGELDPVGLGKRRHEPPEHLLEGLRVEVTEHAAECIVTGNAMLQRQELPQQPLLGATEQRHVAAAFASAQDGRQSNEQDFPQFVLCVRGPCIRQFPRDLLEFDHPTPPVFRESSSESISRANAIAASNPYAIPLPPLQGRVKRVRRSVVL